MSLLAVGLSYRSAPVDVLERVAVSCADADKVLHQLLEREHIAEALLLSTCNRVEAYAVVATFHDGLADITDVLAHQSAMTLDDLSEHLYVHYAVAGVEHLLRLPRNVELAVGDVPGVTLLDLTTTARRLEQHGTGSGAVDNTQHLVAQEVRSYLLAQHTTEIIPTVAALRKRAADVVDAELLRLDGRLPGLDSAVRTELTRTVRRMVDKLLHAPTVRVKQLAEAGGGQAYADALRELFQLDPQAAAAITTPVSSASRVDPSGPDGGTG